MRLGPRSINDGKLNWVKTPEDGACALVIAIIELARRDAEVRPEELAPRSQARAQYEQAHARWFLTGLEEYF